MPALLQTVLALPSPSLRIPEEPLRFRVGKAGVETNPLGHDAIAGMTQLKTAADLMATLNAQAFRLRRLNLVAHIRALEAKNVVYYLEEHNGLPKPGQPAPPPKPGEFPVVLRGLKARLACGPGFGSGDCSYEDPTPITDQTSPALPMPGAGGLGGGLGGGAGGAQANPWVQDYDSAALDVRNAIKNLVEQTSRIREQADRFHAMASRANGMFVKTVNFSADELNMPGFSAPSPLLPTVKIRKPRPTMVAPSWLDFLYSGQSEGTDPYRSPDNDNPFWSPPVLAEKYQVSGGPEENGFQKW